MNVIVFGSTGGSGRAAIERLLADGHDVTAFARRDRALPIENTRLRYFVGDAMNENDVEHAIAGHDAVVVALGIKENPFRVRLFGAARTPLNVRSAGTRNVIAAMYKHGVRKLVVQSSFGVGPTRERLRFVDAAFFELVLKPQIEDTELQEREVIGSDLDWVIVQPVHLTDGSEDGLPFVSAVGETQATTVSRKSVGRFLAHAVSTTALLRSSVALSGARA
jgi:uncharacterized protein YbjT (DUF2867 family)